MVSVSVYAILVTQTFEALATMIVLPTLPFFALSMGANAFSISLLGSAYNLAQMVCSPALGALSDRVGRKTVIVLGLLCQAASNFMMSYAESMSELIAARVAVGMAMSTGPVVMAYIMDEVATESELSRVLSLQRVMTSSGALLGPFIAKAFDDQPFTVLCRGLYLVNVVNLFIVMALLRDGDGFLKEDTLKAASAAVEDETSLASVVKMLRGMLTNRATLALLLVSWVFTLGYGLGDGPEVVFFKEHFNFDKGDVCYYFVVTNLSSLVFSAAVPRMVDSFGALTICKTGCLGSAAVTLGLILFSGLEWIPFVYGALMVGLFGGMIGLGYMHLVRKKCPESMMGTMLGLQGSLNGFAGTIGPPLGGLMYNYNVFLPYALTALFAAMAAGLYGALDDACAPGEGEPLRRARTPAGFQRPKLRRLSTFGCPIYPNKSFASQLHMNILRLEQDPELQRLYRAYSIVLERERAGTSGMKKGATVPGDMAAARAEGHDAAVQLEADLRRVGTHAEMSPPSNELC